MKVACIQMTSGPDMSANLAYLENSIREAAKAGANLIATPENSDFMIDGPARKFEGAKAESDHPFLPAFSALAKELAVTIILGSIAIRSEDSKVYNRCYVFGTDGLVTGTYNKIHLFDVSLPSGEIRRESDLVKAGETLAMIDANDAKIGLSICYDVRFPDMYRSMAKSGAQIFSIPAAFTVSTGEMHWEVLLRARAIENGAFVIAPAQCGTHDGGRHTYGHSMMINPWGKIIAEAGTAPAIIYAEIELDEVARFRQAIPSLQS